MPLDQTILFNCNFDGVSTSIAYQCGGVNESLVTGGGFLSAEKIDTLYRLDPPIAITDVKSISKCFFKKDRFILFFVVVLILKKFYFYLSCTNHRF